MGAFGQATHAIVGQGSDDGHPPVGVGVVVSICESSMTSFFCAARARARCSSINFSKPAVSTLRPRSPEEKGAIARQLAEHVWPLLENGSVKPIIYAEFPLAEAAKAHRLMEESRHIGKIVLTI